MTSHQKQYDACSGTRNVPELSQSLSPEASSLLKIEGPWRLHALSPWLGFPTPLTAELWVVYRNFRLSIALTSVQSQIGHAVSLPQRFVSLNDLDEGLFQSLEFKLPEAK
jgi:hypothetical protein